MDETHSERASGPASSGGNEAHSGSGRKPSFWTRRPVIFIGTAVLAGALFFGLDYLIEALTHESTDDAFLAADVVSVAPQVGGRIERVNVRDNQRVKAGDVLARIDPADYQVVVAQKKAARAAAEANVQLMLSSLKLLATQVATARATAKQAEAQVLADQATAEEAGANFKRAQELIGNKTISPQEFDAAKAAADSAAATTKAAQEKAASDRAKIAEAEAQLGAGRRAWERSQAQARQSAVDVQQADLNLSYTRVIAPVDGWVTRKAVQPGDYVQAGQGLMALVPTNIWVVANFKETELKNIRTHQPVKIHIDALGGREFAGHVQSVQAGSGAAFSLLPPENAVGNYVKVVQRVPVKILFDHPPQTWHPLGPGMSVEPAVRTTPFEVPDFVIAIAAVVLALMAGGLWSRAARKRAGA